MVDRRTIPLIRPHGIVRWETDYTPGLGEMKKTWYCFVLWLALSVSISLAANTETYFKFQIRSTDELHILTRVISIDNVDQLTVYAYANPDELEAFARLGYVYAVLPRPSTLIIPEMRTDKDALLSWDSYPTYSNYVSMMNQFASTYPTMCQIISIGTTANSHALLCAKISSNVGVRVDKPAVFLTSSMHGDELVGYVSMLRLIDYLLSNYGVDPLATRLVDSCEIWINPLANPDGTFYSSDNTVYGATRYNANGIDLNRNFPDPKVGAHPDGHTWQPETIAMMDFAKDHTFVLSVNFHGGSQVVNYPWDTWARSHVDTDWLIAVSRAYADTVHYYGSSGYMTDLNNGITNGYAWYEVNGGRQDYMTYWRGDRELTIELSTTKLPSGSQLPNYWTYNWHSFLHYIENTLYGIRGVVTDSETGTPLLATITIPGHDSDLDSSRIFTDSVAGDYHRMIKAGTYNVQITAPGYYPQTVSGVLVQDRKATRVDVALVSLTAQPLIATTTIPDWTALLPLSFQLLASGGSGTLSWVDKNSDLAGTGLTLSGSGLLSGTPLMSDTLTFIAQVVDQNGHSDEKSFTFRINPVLSIATTSLPDGVAGTAYSQQLVSSGGTGVISWADSGSTLSGSGLTLSAAGLISGTVTSPTVISFTVGASDAVGSRDYRPFTIIFLRGYVCGDANGDARLNVGDPVYLIDYIFKSGSAPNPSNSGDANCDAKVNVGDAVYLINYIFKGGSAPCCP